LARQLPFIILAFCWAHVRRDFMDAAKKYPDLEDWALCWVEKIGKIYHINHLRCKNFDAKLSAQNQYEAFKKQHEKLVKNMDTMACERDDFIKKHNSKDMDTSSNAKYKVLKSLKNHWEGLSVFMDHPEVPMDNNKAERSIRNPVTGRKNFYGSGSLWSSQLAAMMFSIFQTMGLWELNRSHWLKSYLIACAENHGKAPEDLSPFLPWEMDKNHMEKFSKPYET
jgi:transposase